MSDQNPSPNQLKQKQSALLRVMKATITLPAQVTFYASALGAIALIPNADLPTTLATIAGGIGVNILSSILERIARGEQISDDEVRQQVIAAIDESHIAEKLATRRTQAMIGRLFRRHDVLKRVIQHSEYEILKRLTQQAEQYEAFTAELRDDILVIYNAVQELATREQSDDIIALLLEVVALLKRLLISGQLATRTDAPFMAPPDLRQFTAREEELNQLKHMLMDRSGSSVVVCSVAGLGGVGKSALVAHFATNYQQLFPDGVFWARVDSETPMDVAQNIAKALQQDVGVLKNETNAQAAIQRLLSNKRALLVLDNADGEHAAERIKYMRPGGTSVAVLITTRNIALSGAFGAQRLDLDSFRDEEGIALFKKVLGEDPRLADSLKDAYRIVNLLGGLPLAIDIAAQTLARRKEMSFAEYVDSVEQLGISVLQDPNKSVKATLAKSIEILTPSQQSAFFALGACVKTGFSIETAMAVTAINSRNDMQYLLYNLHDLSLIQERSGSRFALHPLVRSYTREQEGISDADCRHAEYWCSYLKKFNRDSVEDWVHITPEWDGIRAAWDWCLDNVRLGAEQLLSAPENIQRSNRLATEICLGLRYFVDARGYWQEALERVPDSLEAAKRLEHREVEYRIRRHLAILLRRTGSYDEAARYNKINIELASRCGRQDWIGQESEQLGRVRVRQKRYAEAETLYMDALRIYRSPETRDARRECQVLNCLGEMYRQQGDLDKTIDFFGQALRNYKGLDDVQGVCATLGHLGATYSDMKKYEKSIWYYASALSLIDRSGRTAVRGSLCQNLGFALESLERYVEALACYVVSADICTRLGISGWGRKRPANARDRLLELLGGDANGFRITSANTIKMVLDKARAQVQDIITSILASGSPPHFRDDAQGNCEDHSFGKESQELLGDG